MTHKLINLLRQLIAFRSVSSDPQCGHHSSKLADYLGTFLLKQGFDTKIVKGGPQTNPLVLGRYIVDPSYPTLLFYNHYDVQPADKSDGWVTDPFELTLQDGYLYGRGATDDKDPLAALLIAIEELMFNNSLKVNLSLIIEGEEESGSQGFKEVVKQYKSWLGSSNCIVITDNYWLNEEDPCLTYGLRGIVYLSVEISGPKRDLHSGEQGGPIYEPLQELVTILGGLTDLTGTIQIPRFYEKVRPISSDELKLYQDIKIDLNAYCEQLGVSGIRATDSTDLLLKRWRQPSLTVHGFEGAFSGPGAKTVIPHRVIGKVSIRTVPDQDPHELVELTKKHLEDAFLNLGSPNYLLITPMHVGDWWMGDPGNAYFQVAAKCIEEVWNTKPLFTREGGSIPITPFLADTFQAPIILIAIGQSSDGAHSQNERIRVLNLHNGKDVLKRFITYVGTEK